MTYISLPEEKDRLLVFYLAMEEYIARYMDVKPGGLTEDSLRKAGFCVS